MSDRITPLGVWSCLMEDIRYLRGSNRTRLYRYSTGFLMEVRRELDAFSEELRQEINKHMVDATGDPRPILAKKDSANA